MTQTTITEEGAFSAAQRTQINANFTDLYTNRIVTTESSANAMATGGLSLMGSSAGTTFTLSAPVAGVAKYLEATAATANITVNTGAAGITIGSTFHNLVFTAADQAVHLLGESATKWIRITQNSTLITSTT